MHITADKIHNGLEWLPQGSTLVLDNEGIVLEILPQPTDTTVFYEGIITPGFINTHCHLELSHMKGAIPERTGLIPFLQKVSLQRNNHTETEKQGARGKAHNELIVNGIVAVGDIANTTDTIELRALNQLHFHTFIEALGFSEINAPRSFGFAEKTYTSFNEQTTGNKLLHQSITPHAPYSVSSNLFKAISRHNVDGPLSIHNQESEAENQFYMDKGGHVNDLLQSLGIDSSHFIPSGLPSLQTYLEWLAPNKKYIFVHNTFSTIADIRFVKNRINDAFWCLCPNANLYIENRLPDLDMLISENANICVGTDSLASNHELNILAELTTIKNQYPYIGWEVLLNWGTLNGAKALGMENLLGSFEAGKQPGILNIKGIDFPGKPTVTRIM